MAEIINLRLARKAKARGEAEKTAEQNRVIFGQTKAEKKLRAAEKVRSDKALEGSKIEDNRQNVDKAEGESIPPKPRG